MPSLFSARRPTHRRSPRVWAAGRLRLAAVPLAGGLLVGSVVQLALPSPVFRAVAVVAPEAGGGKNTADMRQLADFALSRPVLRAAAVRLVDRNEASPLPGPLERLGLIRLDAAADRMARLADQLATSSHAAPNGDALMIAAEAGEPTRAAHLAQAVADAFLAKRAEVTASAQRTREAELASRIAAAEATAGAARKRFLAAGGADAGVERARAAATVEVREAEVRIAHLRTLMASGSPPVADDTIATQAISDLQANYLDLQGKLAQALQTLGERHTTVITLRDSIRRTASELSAAWTRQLRSAEADRDAAKAREAALFRNDPGRDAGKQAALDDARRGKEAADAALLRAEAELDFLPDQPAFALRSAAAVPARAADGWFPIARTAMASVAALAAIALLLAGKLTLARIRVRPSVIQSYGRRSVRVEPAATIPNMSAANDTDAVTFWEAAATSRAVATAAPPPDTQATDPEPAEPLPSVWTAPLRATAAPDDALPSAIHGIVASQAAPSSMAPSTDANAVELPLRFFRSANPGVGEQIAAMRDAMPGASPTSAVIEQLAAIVNRRRPPAAMGEAEALHALNVGFRDVVEGLRGIEPANGPIPTLMVAAAPRDRQKADGAPGVSQAATTDVALAVGEVAAAAGLRVLLIETSRQRALLAGHTAGERRPSLVGMRDGLRLVFAADAVAGLFLAPLFARRAELIAALSRHRGAPIVEEVAAHYDLLIIDGGEAAATAQVGWTADQYLAVDGEATLAASARFLSALGHPAGSFAGTVIDVTFVPPPGTAGDHLPVRARPSPSRLDPTAVAA